MQCPNCGETTLRLIIDKHGSACANCRGLSENGGPRLTNILSRNSDRVRAQQQDFEGTLITPHTFDAVTGQIIPNPDFVKHYADQLPTYFTQKELERAGYSKATRIYEKKAAKEAVHEAEKAAVEFSAQGADEKIAAVIQNA